MYVEIVLEAIVLPPFVAVAIRPRPGVWEYICVNVYELSVDQLGVSEYLCFKEEVDCPCVTPEVVLKASSHVDKFTNIMVKDEKTHTCYSAEYLIKDFCKEKLEKDANISSEKLAELNHMLAALDQMIFLLKN
ncbi:hypothetical protein LguiB_013850 [Lonicera macranthoides]